MNNLYGRLYFLKMVPTICPIIHALLQSHHTPINGAVPLIFTPAGLRDCIGLYGMLGQMLCDF